jgi:hypothetical protein
MLGCLGDTSSARNAYPAIWGPFALIGAGAARKSCRCASQNLPTSRDAAAALARIFARDSCCFAASDQAGIRTQPNKPITLDRLGKPRVHQ